MIEYLVILSLLIIITVRSKQRLLDYLRGYLQQVDNSTPIKLSCPPRIDFLCSDESPQSPKSLDFSREEALLQLKNDQEISQLNQSLDRCINLGYDDIVLSILSQITKVDLPCYWETIDRKLKYDYNESLTPNVYTYSLALKILQKKIKEAKEGNESLYLNFCKDKRFQWNEQKVILSCESLWKEMDKQNIINIVVLNQQPPLLAYSTFLRNIQQIIHYQPDKVTLTQLKKVSYRLSKNLVHLSKQSDFDRVQFVTVLGHCKRVEKLIVSLFSCQENPTYQTFPNEEIDSNKESFESNINSILETYASRYNLQAVTELQQVIETKLQISRVVTFSHAMSYMNVGLVYQNNLVTKILSAYAQDNNQTIEIYILKQLKSILFDLSLAEGFDYIETVERIQDICKIYCDFIAVMVKFNSSWCVIELFTKLIQTISALHQQQIQIQSDTLTGIPFPDIHIMCYVVKALIKERSYLVACKITEFFQHNSESVKGKGKDNELQVDKTQLEKEPYFKILGILNQVSDNISVEINTFLLNGLIIELNSNSQYQRAIDIFNWMCNNMSQHHKPNSSTYNMILLVYGSMKEYDKAKVMFEQMVSQWTELNDNATDLALYDDIYKNIRQHKYYRSSSSSTSAKNGASSIKLLDSDGEDDKYSFSFPTQQNTNYNDVYQLKHSSDILYQKLGLNIPPANMNSIISMCNLLTKQKLFDEVLELTRRLDVFEEKAKHPLLLLDICQKEQLYTCLYKNFMSECNDPMRVQAIKIVIQSLQKGYILPNKTIYKDILKVMNSRNLTDGSLLKVTFLNLLQEREIDISDQPKYYKKNYSVESDDTIKNTSQVRRNSSLSYVSDGNPHQFVESEMSQKGYDGSIQRGYDASEELSISSLTKSQRLSLLQSDVLRRQSMKTPKSQDLKKSNMKKRFSQMVEPIQEIGDEVYSPLPKNNFKQVQVAFKLDEELKSDHTVKVLKFD